MIELDISKHLIILRRRILFLDKLINFEGKDVDNRLINLRKSYVNEYIGTINFSNLKMVK